jgi:hypothetical protein
MSADLLATRGFCRAARTPCAAGQQAPDIACGALCRLVYVGGHIFPAMMAVPTQHLHLAQAHQSKGGDVGPLLKPAPAQQGPTITFQGNLEQLALTCSSLMPGSVVDLAGEVIVSAVRCSLPAVTTGRRDTVGHGSRARNLQPAAWFRSPALSPSAPLNESVPPRRSPAWPPPWQWHI